MTHPRRLSTALVAVALVLAGCGDDDADATGDASASIGGVEDGPDDAADDAVEIVDFKFAPPELTVAPGTEVSFANADSTAHTATAEGGEFNSESIGGGATGTITAPEEAGTYTYICSFHPFMKGTVVVE